MHVSTAIVASYRMKFSTISQIEGNGNYQKQVNFIEACSFMFFLLFLGKKYERVKSMLQVKASRERYCRKDQK